MLSCSELKSSRQHLDSDTKRRRRLIAGILTLLCAVGEPVVRAADSRAEPVALPEIIADPSAGDWVVDRFAGHRMAGPTLIQGPAREVGGLGRCGACPLPDGRVNVVVKILQTSL